MIADYNEAPVAVINMGLEYFSNKLEKDIISGVDEDFDTFEVLELFLPNNFSFTLHRYRCDRKNTVTVYFKSQILNWREILVEILQYLNLDQSNLIEINENYLNIP